MGANVGPDKRLPTDGSILLSFDRMLLPATIVRQSFLVVDAFNVALTPTVNYDPVTRVVTLGNPNRDGSPWLKPDAPYKILFTIPQGEDDRLGGVRAIDRATLDLASVPGNTPGALGFLTTATPSGSPAANAPPEMKFCNDVWPLFQERCSSQRCHGALENVPNARPAAGLILTTSTGLANTAINRVAQGSNTGPQAYASPPGPVFGVDMPIIAPGNPGNSWLMYKLLIAPPPPGPWQGDPKNAATRLKCITTQDVTVKGTPPHAPFEPPVPYMFLSDDERARLDDYILGNVMPYPNHPGSSDTAQNFNLAELQRVSAWIRQGAPVEDCGSCEP